MCFKEPTYPNTQNTILLKNMWGLLSLPIEYLFGTVQSINPKHQHLCLTRVLKKILLHLLSYVRKMTKSESKTFTDTSPKKIYTDATEAYEKMLHITCLQGNVKQQWDTATHLWGWTKSRRWTTPNAGEDVGQQELPFVAGEFGPS